jgi:hypothetical protein
LSSFAAAARAVFTRVCALLLKGAARINDVFELLAQDSASTPWRPDRAPNTLLNVRKS